jgi:2-polyprenyl-3-methyl-5-hydroxy-6-metoxy-1,4-benzoquinol methylase
MTRPKRDYQAIAALAFETAERDWRGGDPWELDQWPLDRLSYARQIELLGDRRYARALELGCAAGAFTRRLSALADHVLAIDIAPSAIERARAAQAAGSSVEFRAANVMELDPVAEGPWDLIVMSETIYCLAWLYSTFELAWLARRLLESTHPGGRFLMANTYGKERDYLLSPWLIDTYRDLFRNVGYELEREETMRAEKGTVEYDVLISLFTRR